MARRKRLDNWINVALPKGRLGNSVYDMLKRAGYDCPEMEEDNRKLIFTNEEKKIRYFQVKPSDVTIYVERGAADIGIAGKDIILENSPEVYELLDLEIGKCRMAEAASKGWREDLGRTLRVATKFPNITRDYFNSESRDIDIIKLHGSIELAPIVGLSDVIVDIVETGTTLKENNLEVINTIVDISARLIANKASFQFKTKEIESIRDALQKEVSGEK
jgi:ATP phosphoribosyltransferase